MATAKKTTTTPATTDPLTWLCRWDREPARFVLMAAIGGGGASTRNVLAVRTHELAALLRVTLDEEGVRSAIDRLIEDRRLQVAIEDPLFRQADAE